MNGHYFQRISLHFGKNGVYGTKTVLLSFFCLNLSQNRQLFLQLFGEIVFKIITSVPGRDHPKRVFHTIDE
jgi:hypothetical protein